MLGRASVLALVLVFVTSCGRVHFDAVDSLAVIAVDGRGHHSCALRSDGALYCWGRNNYGQLGVGFEAPATPPTRVAGEWRKVDVGEWNTCARDRSDALFCWGRNTEGTLGSSMASSSVPLPAAFEATAVVFGEVHACAVTAGKAQCWGEQSCGRVVPGVATATIIPPTDITGLPAIIDLAAHDTQSCALGVDQRVYCWGTWNAIDDVPLSACGTPFGQAIESLVIPEPVVDIEGGCHGHVCARTATGSVYCWGTNLGGQIGNNSRTTALAPQLVQPLPPAHSIAIGGFVTCAVTADGVYCWGNNGRAEFGNDTTIGSLVPLRIATHDGKQIESLTLGCYHGCAVIDQQLHCWGFNTLMAVGDGTTQDRLAPTPIYLP